MAVIVDEQLIPDALRFDEIALRTKRPESHDLADHAIPRDFYGSKLAGSCLSK